MSTPIFSNFKSPIILTGEAVIVTTEEQFRGNYSNIYQGTYKGETVAIKVLKLTGDVTTTERKVKREKVIWANTDHPNIHRCYGFAYDDDAFRPFGALISPWCFNGDASQFLAKNGKCMEVPKRVKLWKGVIDGIVYLHGNNPIIIHGDLTPRNILIGDNGEPKICDFGLARLVLEEEEKTHMTTRGEHTGTARYLAPELVASDRNVLPTIASDIYALGCIGLEFIYLQQPHTTRQANRVGHADIYRDLSGGAPPATAPPSQLERGSLVWDLLVRCWSFKPAHRPLAFAVANTMDATQLNEPKNLTGSVTFDTRGPEFRGHYSSVYRGNYGREAVAVKIISLTGKPEYMKRRVMREVTIWATASHKNVHPFYGIADEEEYPPVGALISPWCAKGDADRFLRENGEHLLLTDRINLWKGVMDGVVYLHGHKPTIIIHGDLKPKNVLIDDFGTPRICDFGLARIFLKERSIGLSTKAEHTGTTRYLAPELIASDVSVPPSAASDVYALGCIGLRFIYGYEPYQWRKNDMRGGITSDIKKGVPPATEPPQRQWSSNRAWSRMTEYWSFNPVKRPTAAFAAHLLEQTSFGLPPAVIHNIVFFLATACRNGDPLSFSQTEWKMRSEHLRTLCLVSRACRSFAIPFLYQDIRMHLCTDFSNLHSLKDTLTRSAERDRTCEHEAFNGYGNYTKTLVLLMDVAQSSILTIDHLSNAVQSLLKLMPELLVVLVSAADTPEHASTVTLHTLITLDLQGLDLPYLVNLVSTFQSWFYLQRLCIRGCLHKVSVQPVAQIPTGADFPNLQYLTIQHSSRSDADDGVTVLTLLESLTDWTLPRLRYLELHLWDLPSPFQAPFLAFLRNHRSNLQHLTLAIENSRFVELTRPLIVDVLSTCEDLRSISLDLYSLCDLNMAHPTLETISLACRDRRHRISSDVYAITYQNLDSFAVFKMNAIHQFPKLTSAELRWCYRKQYYHNSYGAPVHASAFFRTGDQYITINDGERSYKRHDHHSPMKAIPVEITKVAELD